MALSQSLENITEAYDMASHGNGFNEEFVIDEPTRKNMEDYLYITDMLHTDLHECSAMPPDNFSRC